MDYVISILVGIMAICAVFITVPPVIDRFRDRKIKQQERKIKNLIAEMEELNKRIELQENNSEEMLKLFSEEFKNYINK